MRWAYPSTKLKGKVESLHEFNPMMGTPRLPSGRYFIRRSPRCRPRLSYPQLSMSGRKTAWHITPEIMVPLVSEVNELRFVKKVIKAKADELIEQSGLKMKYMVGTMIETPRAAVTAGDVAKEAEFFSFGTNDLTQMTYGFSRDDVGRIPGDLLRQEDPRVRSVRSPGPERRRPPDPASLLQIGKRTRPDIKLGICGEHGGDPVLRRVLPQCWPELRFLLAVPRADRTSGSGTGSCKGTWTGINLPKLDIQRERLRSIAPKPFVFGLSRNYGSADKQERTVGRSKVVRKFLFRNFLPPDVKNRTLSLRGFFWPRCVAHVPGFLAFARQMLFYARIRAIFREPSPHPLQSALR